MLPQLRSPLCRTLLAALLAAPLAPAPSRAADTQWWIVNSAADHARSESRGVVVGADGVLGLGLAAASSPAESLQVIWAIAPLPDGSVAIGGDRGRVDRWTEKDGVRPWVRLAAGQVLSLSYAHGELVAGTAPNGLLYRIGLTGDTALMARTGERYVWGLAPAGKGEWFAATGSRGRVLHIRGGRCEILFDSEESNVISIVGDGAGGVYAGGDSRGRVFHVRPGRPTRTVFDAAEDEIRALAVGADGALYAAALSATAVTDDDEVAGIQPVRSPVSGGRAVVYRIVPDSLAQSWWSSAQPFVYALIARPAGILAGAGNRGAIYDLQRATGAAQVLAVPQGQITAMAADGAGRVYAAASNPGTLWRLGPRRAEEGELISPALDARRHARWGRVRWEGEPAGGRVELWTRSGNADPPDSTWSAWEGGAAGTEGRRSGSPPARFFQWKLRLLGGAPRIESVETAWREQNLPPRIEELVVAPQGHGFREGELTPRADAVTQTLPGGQKVEYSLQSPASPRALRELPMWARGLRTVQWRGVDPNGDALRYRVEVREEGADSWTEVGEELDAVSFTWDTNGLPDGRFRLRVTASDAASNAYGEERSESALSEPFTVDNTPPVLTGMEARRAGGTLEVAGRAEDAASPIARIELSLDDGDWRAVAAENGMTDERALGFRARVPGVSDAAHTVAVRIVDLAGNSALRSIRVAGAARR